MSILALILVPLTVGLWWWYLVLKKTALDLGHNFKWMFKWQLIRAWISTLITIAFLVYLLLGPGLSIYAY